MIKLLIIGVLLICGILELVLPKEKLVNKEKLKEEQDFHKLVKQNRTMGIVFICIAVILFFIM